MRLILASQSSARRRMLEAAGVPFEALPAQVDEAAIKESARAEGMGARDAATLLADAKAARIARRHPDALVIGADQLLVLGEDWLDKPEDLGAARRQLQRLRGHRHELVTAVVGWRDGQRAWHHVSAPRVSMRDFSDAFLEEYLAREAEHVTHCVGAYRIEGPGVGLMRDVQGDFFAVLGLPLLPLLAWLRDTGAITA
ncbi:Maf family protein [Roseococcus sp. DSY-14]|uniref:Maf family protein n=1 Tax=Roseococcus sp. DSY-14 TaxID=3369650 RepID=UPI00387A8D71